MTDQELIIATYTDEYKKWQIKDDALAANITEIKHEIAKLELIIDDINAYIAMISYELDNITIVQKTLNKILGKKTNVELEIETRQKELNATKSIIKEKEIDLFAAVIKYENHALKIPKRELYEIAMYGGNLFKVL